MSYMSQRNTMYTVLCTLLMLLTAKCALCATPELHRANAAERRLLQTAPAPAPTADLCSLPNGQVIDAPNTTVSGSEEGFFQALGNGIGAFFDSFFGRRRLLAASTAPACCPSYTVQNGDTVQSILESNNLPSSTQYQSAFTALNGNSLIQGQSATLPCNRLLSYAASHSAPAPAPAGAATVKAG